MKFTYHYTTRWHDTDAKREVRPSQILAYMQETSNYHIASSGMSLDELRDRHGLAFLLSQITMRMYLPLHTGEEIDVQTWICESRGLRFLRCFRILRGEDVIAEAFTVWALMNLHEGKLLPVTAFPYNIEPDAPLGAEFMGRVRLPSLDQMQEIGTRKIVYSDIDYNGHMNNTRYPDMLCDFTPDMDKRRAVGVTLSFLNEATFGHTLKVCRLERPLPETIASHGAEYCYRTIDTDGKICLEAILQVADG